MSSSSLPIDEQTTDEFTTEVNVTEKYEIEPGEKREGNSRPLD